MNEEDRPEQLDGPSSHGAGLSKMSDTGPCPQTRDEKVGDIEVVCTALARTYCSEVTCGKCGGNKVYLEGEPKQNGGITEYRFHCASCDRVWHGMYFKAGPKLDKEFKITTEKGLLKGE